MSTTAYNCHYLSKVTLKLYQKINLRKVPEKGKIQVKK
jgi:hypothetical protein